MKREFNRSLFALKQPHPYYTIKSKMIKKKKTVVHHINSLDEKYHVLMLKIEYTFFGKRVYKKKKEEIHEGLYLKNPY